VIGEDRCELFWETGTQIGSDIPSPVVTEPAEEGTNYPVNRCVDYVFESGSAK
jgi:hypothetical protein